MKMTFDPQHAKEMVALARTVIGKYGADTDKPSVHLATALIDGAHERDRLRALLKDAEEDARRYRRLRVLGCAPVNTKQLDNGTVLCFTNLDRHVDDDIKAHPSRGEYRQSEATP